MSLELSDDERAQLAADVAEELDTGRYGDRFVLSRRQLLSIAGGSAGVAGLVALGVDPATAQSAAGQVGTQSSPEDVFAYNLDVQGGAEFNGNDLRGVGSFSTESLVIGGTLFELDGIIDVSATTSTTYTLNSPADQVIIVEDDGSTGFDELQVNGITSGYIATDTADAETTSLSQWPINAAFEREYIYLENRADIEINMGINLIGGGTGLTSRGQISASGSISSVTFSDSNGKSRDQRALVLKRAI